MLMSGSLPSGVLHAWIGSGKKSNRVVDRRVIAYSSKREPKDPSQFGSYDDLRDHLQGEGENGSGGLGRILSRLGNEAFGNQKSIKGVYNHFYRSILQSSWVQSLDKSITVNQEGATDWRAQQRMLNELESKVAQNPKTRELAVLLVCSVEDAARLAVKYPEIMEKPNDEILSRMIFLRETLPGCNIARMVSLAPRLFLGGNWGTSKRIIVKNSSLLRNALNPVNIEYMVQEDPDLLFRDLSGCMENLFDLWDIDEDALKACNPGELALAIKALSKDGVPPKF